MRLFPCKGASQYGKPIATKPKKKNTHGVYLVMVGTDNAKDIISERLSIVPDEPGKRKPGCIHFPMKEWCNLSFFQQMLVEYKKPFFVNGQKSYKWHCPDGARNEKLDCEVYNLAALRVAQQYFALDLDSLAAIPVNVAETANVTSDSSSMADLGKLLNGS